jgi:hypothetical protein
MNLNMNPAEGPRRRKGTAAGGGRASRVRNPPSVGIPASEKFKFTLKFMFK